MALSTRGLTHIALAVRDMDRTFAFYRELLGVEEVYRQPGFLQVQTPGAWDVIVFEEDPDRAGRQGGVIHFGFRVTDPAEVQRAAEAITRGGGSVRETGEFVPGEPYIFASDPDGYEVEIWYEAPTPVDPS